MPSEALAVWSLFAVSALAVLVTYARLPPEVLYNTSVDGLRGGLGRTLVFVNFPTALAAIALILVAADRLGRRAALPAAGGIASCAVVALPGVVDQRDLDAKLVNLVPLAGVALALGMTAIVVRNGIELRRRAVGDGIRLALAAVLLLLAVPWYFAETGFYAPDPILADEIPEGVAPEQHTLAAVHLGHHHGTDGVLLALAALALSRVLGSFRFRRVELVFSVYVALMLAYGTANALQDFTLEQVYKRDWIDWQPPPLLRPELSLAWAAVLAGAAVVEATWFRRARAPR